MVDEEKPFPCDSPGCSMRFANEDRLSIHKKRHISLTIESINESKTPNFVADETPTPTRFIRNCEEVGLFQEIGLMQNMNPFDEQFRRAAEVSTLTTPTSLSTDDALHTPHVFPVSIETETMGDLPLPKLANTRKNPLMPSLSTTECLTIPSPLANPTPLPTPTITVSSPSGSVATLEESVKNTPETNNAAISLSCPNLKKEKGNKFSNLPPPPRLSQSVITNGVNILPRPVFPTPCQPLATTDPLTTVLLRLPDGRLVQIPAIPVGATDSSVSLTTAIVNTPAPTPVVPINIESTSTSSPQPKESEISEAKKKLKQALSKQKKQAPSPNPVVFSITNDASGTDTDQSIITLPDSDYPKTNLKKRRRESNFASDPDAESEEGEKRRKFLERNRAAAFRSRQKRKRWVNNLEAKAANLNASNKLLQNEVLALRTEVAQLKLQLLAHKDCPVTLAMCQQDTGRLSSTNENSTSSTSTNQRPEVIGPTVSCSAPGQFIILNSTNPVPSPLPHIKSSTTPVIIGSPPIVVVPRVDGSSAIKVDNQPNEIHTSVIMSLK